MATNPANSGQIAPDEAAVAANVEVAKDAFAKALGVSEHALEYEEKRVKLLHAESEKAWDREAKDGASAPEKQAGAITRAIREFERDVVFGSIPREELPDDDSLDMGGQFLTNKDRIEEQSKVFEIATQVPKGAILHLHFNAELHPRRLLQEARNNEHMRIRSIRPLLTIDDLDKTEMVFVVKPADYHPADVFDPEYPAKTASSHKDKNIEPYIWMKYSEFRQAFNGLYGDKYAETATKLPKPKTLRHCGEQDYVYLDPAEEWLLEKMVLSEEEAYEPSQTTNGVWARFNQATRLFKGLVSYEQVYTWYISNAIDHLIAEKIMYAELRPMLMDKHIDTDDGLGRITNAGQMELILEAVEAKRKELEKIGKADLFPFGLKIIYCTPRSIPNAKMVEELKDCLDLKVRYPDLICGFDLVGAEDRQNHIGHYYKELVAFQKACKERNLEIPFMFHAGETLLDTGGSLDRDPNKSNLYDACLLDAKRIGHGFSLLKHPHLLEKFKKTDTQPGICIELCPISNELLHLCRNIKEHPYPELLAAGIPCTINSDNPSLFSNSMSHEFYQVMVGAPSMSIHSWKQLALWSLEYSCLSEAEIERGKAIFLASWEVFCKSVVEKYSELGFFKGDTFVVGEVIQSEKGEDVISYDKVKEMYKLSPLPKGELKLNSKLVPETSVSTS